MRSLVETLALLVPFLAPYPSWLKLLAGAWVVLSAVLVLSLLFARPPHQSVETQPAARGAPPSPTSPSVVVEGPVAGSVIISQGQMGGQVAHQITNLGPQPRKLAAEAIDSLVRELSRLPRQRYEIETVHGDSEARNLAFQINDALQRAGWSSTAFASSLFPQPITGLEVSAPSSTREVEAIVSLLSNAGLSTRLKVLPTLTQVHILVGTQP
jgi:hypothetical protein